jgi:microcystin degradation protein MlrC
MQGLVQHMKTLEGVGGVLSVSLGHGFDFGDVAEAGTKVWAVTDNDPELARSVAADIGRRLWALRHAISTPLLTLDAALDEVERLAARSAPAAPAVPHGPVVIADTADNPGGGARGDSSFALQAVLQRGLRDIALGGLWDPGAVQICREAGVGAWLNLRVGGKSGPTSGQPIDLRVQVRAVAPDHFQTAFGSRTPLGASAWVATERGVDVVLISRCDQVIGTDLFTGLGIDLATRRAVIVKSMQHFHAAFSPLASQVLYADSPGLLTSDHTQRPFKRRPLNFWPRVANPFDA